MKLQTSYYRLKPEWVLRGWENLPHTLVNTETGQVAALDKATFLAAAAGDGETDLDLPIFLDVHRRARDRLLADGLLERIDVPSPISDFQRYRKAHNPFYKTLHWSVTGSCNLKCRHCYLCAPDRKYEDLTFPEILRLMDEMAEAGIMEVSITGGEPFVRKDIWDILALFVERKIRVSQIYTNGVLVDDRVLERIEWLLGPWGSRNGEKTEFSISFDGVGTHDDIRGIEGTEEKTVRAIERIIAHGFPVSIETVLYRKNVNRMDDTLRLLSEKGVRAWKISGVGDSGKWLETGGAENLSIEETFECYLNLLRTFLSLGRPLSIQMGGFYIFSKRSDMEGPPYGGFEEKLRENCLKQYSCNACRFIRYMLPDGTLLPCLPMTETGVHKNMPNVRSRGLIEALRSPNLWEIASIKVGDLIERNQECAECEYLGKCTLGCRACALIYGDGVFGKDPFTCHYWKADYPARILELIRAHESQVNRS